VALRISVTVLIIAIFLLAENLVSGTPNPGASQISELAPAAFQPR